MLYQTICLIPLHQHYYRCLSLKLNSINSTVIEIFPALIILSFVTLSKPRFTKYNFNYKCAVKRKIFIQIMNKWNLVKSSTVLITLNSYRLISWPIKDFSTKVNLLLDFGDVIIEKHWCLHSLVYSFLFVIELQMHI